LESSPESAAKVASERNLEKDLRVSKLVLIFAIPFGTNLRVWLKKILKKDLQDSKIVLIFAIPFAY